MKTSLIFKSIKASFLSNSLSNSLSNFISNLQLSILCLASLAALTACSPRDPDVLSDSDKQFIANAKNKKFNQQNADRPSLPQKAEVATGLLVADRESQVYQILLKSFDLIKNKVSTAPSAKNCENWILMKSTDDAQGSQLVYRYNREMCAQNFTDLQLSVNGSSMLTLQVRHLPEGVDELLRVTLQIGDVSSSPVAVMDGDLSVPETQFYKNNFTGSFVVQDLVNFDLVKKTDAAVAAGENSVFLLKQFVAVSRLRLSETTKAKDGASVAQRTETLLQHEAAGEFTVSSATNVLLSTQLHHSFNVKSNLLRAGVQIADSSFRSLFDTDTTKQGLFEADCTRWSPALNYVLSFGKTPRSGSLLFSTSSVQSSSQNPKTKKIETGTFEVAACSKRPAISWDQWLLITSSPSNGK